MTVKEFDINMAGHNNQNAYTLEEINDMFIDWVESKALNCGGSMSPADPELCQCEGKHIKHFISNVCDDCNKNIS